MTPLVHVMGEMIRPRAGHQMLFTFDRLMDDTAIRAHCPEVRFVCSAKLRSRRLVFSRSGTTTIVSARGAEVHGVVWEVRESVIPALDAKFDVPEIRSRRGAFARSADSQLIPCEHYFGRDCRAGKPEPREVLGLIELAKYWGFPSSYVRELVGWLGQAVH